MQVINYFLNKINDNLIHIENIYSKAQNLSIDFTSVSDKLVLTTKNFNSELFLNQIQEIDKKVELILNNCVECVLGD